MFESLRPGLRLRRVRPAFTLVELLVVIAIIGTLIALLLPAVQGAREAARRTQCMDNVKNLGLGCLTYESVRKKLPPGKEVRYNAAASGNCGDPGKNNFTNWALEILPYIEEKALFTDYRFDLMNSAPENERVVATNLKLMTCPSDPNGSRKVVPDNGDAGTNLFAVGSYKGVSGRSYAGDGAAGEAYWDSAKSSGTLDPTDRGSLSLLFNPSAGCFMGSMSRKPVRLVDIRDGTSKTMLIGEYTTISKDNRSALWANSHFSNNLATITLPGGCKANPMTCATVINGISYNNIMDPDYDKCAADGAIAGYGARPCRCAFTGFHGGRGAINFVFTDGAVHRILNTSDLRVLAALTTINGQGREPVNSIP
jgi:prepilin-type N-terminal cleavage/methylation domain-containing protein